MIRSFLGKRLFDDPSQLFWPLQEIDETDKYEYLNDVDLKVDYNYGYWGGGVDPKTFPSTGPSRVNGTSTILITVINGEQVRATFSSRRSDGTTDTQTEVSGSLKVGNLGYGNWVWNITVFFELPRSAGGNFDPNRPVVFKKAGHFLMERCTILTPIKIQLPNNYLCCSQEQK